MYKFFFFNLNLKQNLADILIIFIYATLKIYHADASMAKYYYFVTFWQNYMLSNDIRATFRRFLQEFQKIFWRFHKIIKSNKEKKERKKLTGTEDKKKQILFW